LSAGKVPTEQWNDYKKWVRFICISAKNTFMTPRILKRFPNLLKACIENQSAAHKCRLKFDRLLFACSNSRSPEQGLIQNPPIPPAPELPPLLSGEVQLTDSRQKANAAGGKSTQIKRRNHASPLFAQNPEVLFVYTQKLRGFLVNKDPRFWTRRTLKSI